MLSKSITDICYNDIVKLKDDKMCESDVLDYKETIPDKAKLISHACAFANRRGGYLVFGVKESGDGGYPTDIIGINKTEIEKERLENIILSHVAPRLNVNIKEVEIPNKEKSVLLVQIPDSYNRPHYNDINNKFYKRFNFQSIPMTEQEIAYCYQSRFSNNKRVDKYVKKIMVGREPDSIATNIVVIPSNIDNRLIDTSDYKKFEWINGIKLRNYLNLHRRLLSSSLEPFANGLISKGDGEFLAETRFHRNGCTHHIMRFNRENTPMEHPHNYIDFPYVRLAEKVIHTICLAYRIMEHYNYFGDVKIIVNLASSSPTRAVGMFTGRALERLKAWIEREHSSQYIKSHYENIAASIMHELMNHYGVERCDCFDENGNWDVRNNETNPGVTIH